MRAINVLDSHFHGNDIGRDGNDRGRGIVASNLSTSLFFDINFHASIKVPFGKSEYILKCLHHWGSLRDEILNLQIPSYFIFLTPVGFLP